MYMPHKRKALFLMLTTAMMTGNVLAAEDSVELSDIEVIGTTPLHGVGLPADMIPTNVQTATAEDIEKVQSLDLSDFMTRTLGSVNINSAQNNPYQPDVNYRGFSATPLLGMPQGLAVYMDGVRLNAPFGDNVHWDTIPQSAIASINLMPGSNPLFGLNTLGGALSIQTKNGFTHEGHSIQGYAGSHNRRATEFESGGNDGTLGYFVTGNWFKEDGWRDHSESEVKQAFANVSWRSDTSTLDLSLTATDNDLNGNGASPVELIAQDRAAVFTWPDNTKNKMQLLNLSASHWINDDLLASGNAYYRHSKTDSFNGDGTPYAEGTGANTNLLVDFDPLGNEVLVEDQNGNNIADTFGAINNRGFLRENSGGLSGQLTFLQDLAGMENQLVTGASYDRGTSDYSSTVEIADLTADRGTTGSGLFVVDEAVNVTATNRSYALFFTDTLSVTDQLAVTLSGRYNNTKIKVQDHLDPTSTVNATHNFNRFNPAAGLTFAFNEAMTTYLNYSESSRAPTPSELGCSDPNAPCSLPNAFLADPPLEQVVAKSWEGGLRGVFAENISWNAGLFTTTNHDDIMFISAENTSATGNTGYFDNIGKTRRQGVELGVSGEQGALSWAANYSYVKAEFRSPLTINSPNHPNAVGNEIQVQSGDTIPGIPAHNLKLAADYQFTPKFAFGADAIVNSGQYYRGDEANLLGETGGYTVINLHADYHITSTIKIFAKVNNLLDKDYTNFGLLGDPTEILAGTSDNRFQGVGAPRAGWIGIKVSM